MTTAGIARRPTTSVIARALLIAGAAGVLLFAGPTALAQQGWETSVLVGPALPKAAIRPPPKATARSAKLPVTFAATMDAAIQRSAMPEDHSNVAGAVGPAAKGKFETGSIKGEYAKEYCANIASPAADARFAWQKKTLADMEQAIGKRIEVLEEKTAEYQKWLARRDEFAKKASETVLRIYARMRPDAAAVQLAALDEETAASVLIKLEPRTASLILNEMEPSQAVRLTATISGAGKVAPVSPPKAAAAGEKK